MARTFRIHPAIGVARVGNSPEGFIGPERPAIPANWDFDTGRFRKFKDDQHRIKRQGVRFRVFEFDDAGELVGEVVGGTRDIQRIDWTVHVANKKASFYQFDASKGSNGDFSQPRRNAQEPNRVGLEIDPGPCKISGKGTAPIALANPNVRTSTEIPDLGDISTDEEGRLLFFGGHGNVHRGANAISDYVNNDGWFDDVSDGPVNADVVLADGTVIGAVAAWVTVGPPDFAPAVANVVSLYETMWDVAVQNGSVPIPALQMFEPGGALARLRQQRADWNPTTRRFSTQRASFVQDIAYLFERAFNANYTHSPDDARSFHNPLAPQMWEDLADPQNRPDRDYILSRVRDPDGAIANSGEMPRGLGDEYFDETDPPPDPAVAIKARTNPKRFFAITHTQYALLCQWRDGVFDSDGKGPPGIPTELPPITPEGLDRAALENCVGGPFYPGIEVSWIVRNPNIYLEPFRVRAGVVVADGVVTGPGFFTQQMALPWQADFRDCKRERVTSTSNGDSAWAMWWAGQRPDDVYPEDDPNTNVHWTRPPHFTHSDDDDARFEDMVQGWSTLGFVAKKEDEGHKWLEVERTP